MADAFVYGVGAEEFLQSVLNGHAATQWGLALNSDSVPPTPSDANAFGYVKPIGLPGYYDQFSGSSVINFANAGGVATVSFSAPFVWNFGANAGGFTIYSWWVWDNSTATLLFGGQLEPPLVVPLAGTPLHLGPLTFTWGNCSPGFVSPFLLAARFNAPSGTSLLSYVPEIGPSAETFALAGTLNATIEEHMGVMSQTTNTASNVVFNVAASNVTLSGFIKALPSGEDAGLTFRLSDSINFNIFEFDETTNLATLFKCVAGTFTPLDSVAFTPGGTGGHWLEVTADSFGVTASIDGSASLAYGSASFNSTATKHGVFMGGEQSHPTVSFNGLLISSP